tara:strand:+ start:2508 stop:3104 length:597 start_codon:yes stop_codon:yes gene_type:complete
MSLAGVLDLDEHRTFDNAGLLPNFYALHRTPNYSSSLRYHTFDLIHANRRDKNRVFAASAHIATALPPTLEVNTTTPEQSFTSLRPQLSLISNRIRSPSRWAASSLIAHPKTLRTRSVRHWITLSIGPSNWVGSAQANPFLLEKGACKQAARLSEKQGRAVAPFWGNTANGAESGAVALRQSRHRTPNRQQRISQPAA